MRKKIYHSTFIIATGVFAYLSYNIFRVIKKSIDSVSKNELRLNIYYDVLYKWIRMLYSGKSLSKHLEDNGCKTVAIYGLGKLAFALIKELKNSNIKVLYYIISNENEAIFIDEDITTSEIPDIIKISDIPDREQPDVIIVTPAHAFKAIERDLKSVFKNKIVSIEDIINDMD